jgi:hypothetical protein
VGIHSMQAARAMPKHRAIVTQLNCVVRETVMGGTTHSKALSGLHDKVNAV